MHKSVLLKEAIDALHIENGRKYIDATVGAGGHSLEILRSGAKVLGLDADPKMLALATARIQEAGLSGNFTAVNANFRDIEEVSRKHGFDDASGILFDLGVSSIHFDSDNRGFSFKDPEQPLDMRLSPESMAVSAADLLNSLPEKEIQKMFATSMPHHEATRLARKVVFRRKEGKFETVADFVALFPAHVGRVHPATKAFQALRIAVNTELDALNKALPAAFNLLVPGGRLVVISFHSGEDRLVKHFAQDVAAKRLAHDAKGMVEAGSNELRANPRARSAKMRTIIKK